MNTLDILLAKSDDWQGLYVNDELYIEGRGIYPSVIVAIVQDNLPIDEIGFTEEWVDQEWFDSVDSFPSNTGEIKWLF